MNAFEIAERVKQVIMKELFIDISDKLCILDLYVTNSEKSKNIQISKVSQVFIEQTSEKLLTEYNKGKILFFRKYDYEKILNDHLQKKYNVQYSEFDMFPSEKKQNKLEQQQKRKLEEKACREKEERIIEGLAGLKWEKTVRVATIVYKSVDENGKVLELHYVTGKANRKKVINNKLLYDKSPLSYVEYDVNKVVSIIEKTKPKNMKAENIVAVFNNKESIKSTKKTKKTSVNKQDRNEQELKTLKVQSAIENISENYKVNVSSVNKVIEQIGNTCSYAKNGKCLRLNEKCRPYKKQCILYYRFLSKLLEKSKEQNVTKKKIIDKSIQKDTDVNVKPEKKTYEIGMKDFVVRANVFRCMHNKHRIDNVDAMINIDKDGKNELIKISAGYCSQCKVFFILDSTYQNLKMKGMILCRVTDEKNYMKSGYMNGMQLAQESILMQYGYSVSKTEGLSTTGRQKILAVIIDNKIMSKSEIISYLDFFISQRSSMPKMEIAISKWETDREFVENYKTGQYTKFGVNAIYRR